MASLMPATLWAGRLSMTMISPRPQGRRQHLFAPGEEDLAIHRLVDEHRRDDAGKRQSADEGDGLPMSVGDRGATASALSGPTRAAAPSWSIARFRR